MNDDKLQLARVEQLLEENLTLAEENNKLLRDMRRWSRFSVFFRILVWAAVIILPLLLLRPLIETFVPATSGMQGSGFFGFPTQEDIERAIDSYQSE